jgi:hypothetical protein
METYLFCVAVFAAVLNVVQCVKARKDKAIIARKDELLRYAEHLASHHTNRLSNNITDLNRTIGSHQLRLEALDWICDNPCGRKTRKFLKSARDNSLEYAVNEYGHEIRGDA